MSQLKFIDLFSGIGGFHLALSKIGMKCVFACEIDKYARIVYENFFKTHSPELFLNNNFAADIRKINPIDIPDFDLLTAGFPCQPFSQAGKKKGFNESRGTLFWNIAEIIKIKQPKAFFLENVRNLASHDNGNTLNVIRKTLTNLGYSFHSQVLKASAYGLPTHRPRIYIVGFKDYAGKFEFPAPLPLKFTMSDVFNGECNKTIGYTLRVGGKNSGINDRRNWDTYLVDGIERTIDVNESKKIMGFPDDLDLSLVSITQAKKQLGNSVAVNVIEEIGKQILKYT